MIKELLKEAKWQTMEMFSGNSYFIKGPYGKIYYTFFMARRSKVERKLSRLNKQHGAGTYYIERFI